MSPSRSLELISRRAFGRRVAAVAGSGAILTPALSLVLPGTALAQHQGHADEPPRTGLTGEPSHKGHVDVARLPFHLQHEFAHAISCNNFVAKAEEMTIGGQKQHAIQQRPGTFGWGLITFFLRLDQSLMGKEMTFFSTAGWNGKAEGEAVFSVEINGDIIIDGARSEKDKWAEVERKLLVKARELRVTLMLDSIRGNNDFSFWWGEPQLKA